MKKFFLCIIVSLMMIFGGYIPAYAAYTPINGGTFEFNHFLKMKINANVPPITFTCSIIPGRAEGTIYPGPAGATISNVVYDSNSLTYTTPQGTDDVILDTGEKYARGNISVDLTKVTFNNPGIYRYILSGVKSGATGGIITSSEAYLDVYITENTTTRQLEVSSTFLHLPNDTEKVKSITDLYISNDLKLINHVTGNQGDRSKEFRFTITIDGGANDKKYLIKQAGSPEATITSQQAVEIELKHGEEADIYGLSSNDKYTITQQNYTANGYDTKYSINNATPVVAFSTGERIEGNIDNTIIFTNHKDISEPVTGIILNRLPYIIMIALAVGFGSLFFLKKRIKMNNK